MDNSDDKIRIIEAEVNPLTGSVVNLKVGRELTNEEAREISHSQKEFVRNPREVEVLMGKIDRVIPLSKKDYGGTVTNDGEESHRWLLGDTGEAFYQLDKQSKLNKKETGRDLGIIPTPPKLGISQTKNRDAILSMLQKKNYNREQTGLEKTGELDFFFKDYALERGYSEEEIVRSGKFIDDLKKDLYTGAYTTYMVRNVLVEGKRYTAHGVANLYTLLEPNNKKGAWKLRLNEPYLSYITKGKMDFSPTLLVAIQDRGTNGKNGHLHLFHKLVMSRGGDYGGKDKKTGRDKKRPAEKVSSLLERIGFEVHTTSAPGRSFEALMECIDHEASSYGTIKSVFFAKFNKGFRHAKRRVELSPITDLSRFKNWTLADFKAEVLDELGLTDVRDVMVGFHCGLESMDTTPKEDKSNAKEGEELGDWRPTSVSLP